MTQGVKGTKTLGIRLNGPQFMPPISRVSIPTTPAARTPFAEAASGRKLPMSKTRLPRIVKETFPQAKTVSDSPVSLQVRVTGQDCQGATPLRPESCAMAKAVRRELQVDGALIGIGTSYLLKGTHLVRFQTPISLGREITTFDRHGDFQPGFYRLSSIGKSTRLGQSRRKLGVADGSRPRRQPIIHQRTEGTRQLRQPIED